jgi:cell pole-organizing protein PopZ
MEDILASIRKILSEDEGDAAKTEAPKAAASPPPPPPPPPPAEPEPPAASIFDEPTEPEPEPEAEPEPLHLSSTMMVEQDVAPMEPEPQHEPVYEQQQMHEPMQQQDFGQGYQQLVSEPVAQASSASIATLASAVARERAIALGNSGITLEQLVREICTPILKEWLDTNLPFMVERVVKQEIQRIVNRSKGV